MKVQRRKFELGEIRDFYSPRQVFGDGDYFSIVPLSEAEGPVILELPKMLPVDSHDRLINPTAAYDDFEHQLAEALNIELDGDVYLRMGQSGSDATALRQKLILDDTTPPDTIQIIVHHCAMPAWGGPKLPDLPPWTAEQILVSERVYLPSLDYVDFLLLKIDHAPSEFLKDFAIIRETYLLEMFDEKA